VSLNRTQGPTINSKHNPVPTIKPQDTMSTDVPVGKPPQSPSKGTTTNATVNSTGNHSRLQFGSSTDVSKQVGGGNMQSPEAKNTSANSPK
jgi:hypothetical protein